MAIGEERFHEPSCIRFNSLSICAIRSIREAFPVWSITACSVKATPAEVGAATESGASVRREQSVLNCLHRWHPFRSTRSHLDRRARHASHAKTPLLRALLFCTSAPTSCGRPYLSLAWPSLCILLRRLHAPIAFGCKFHGWFQSIGITLWTASGSWHRQAGHVTAR